MRPTVTRRFEFDAGHRVLDHQGKCRHLHGHRYVAEVTVMTQDLDELGMVVDFSVLKEKVGSWIDRQWDHNMILHPDDPLLMAKLQAEDADSFLGDYVRAAFGDKDPYVMKSNYGSKYANPTAENMARELFQKAIELLQGSQITVLKVRLFETPNCWADYPQTN